MGKYIPGNPTIIVDNMPGAGSLVAANHVYKAVKPDGLTIASYSTQILNEILGRPGIEFDSKKFEYIGGPDQDNIVCILTKASGITNAEEWMASKSPVKLGGLAPGTHSTDNLARIARSVLGFPTQVISGYKGTADIRLAAESGEIAGLTMSWQTVKTTWSKALETGTINVMMQATPKPMPDLPKTPLAISFAKTDEARRMIEVAIHDNSFIARPYAVTPGTPKERVEILRKAFMEAFKDKELLAEAQKAKLEPDPVSGEQMEKAVAGFYTKLNPDLIAKLKDVLFK